MRIFLLIFCFLSITPIAKADFGDANFPEGTFDYSPKSYHDAWCRYINNECRVRFQKNAMWVEGKGGIYSSQFIKYRYDTDIKTQGLFSNSGQGEYYNYITYLSDKGEIREALFLFANRKAQGEFIRAFLKWKDQDGQPTPNYRLPNSQGPQDTQGRDGGLNPYDKPPIIDFMKKTTNEKKGKIGNINCDSPVWKNKPRCN